MSKVTPFWFQPPDQAIEFRLRPLTQPQMVEVEEHRGADGTISRKGQWVAGTLGIIGIRGATHPDTGNSAAVPECFQWIDRNLIRMCGLRLIINDQGLDWEKALKGEHGQPDAPEADPAKNS